jgi:hypothetical protein
MKYVPGIIRQLLRKYVFALISSIRNEKYGTGGIDDNKLHGLWINLNEEIDLIDRPGELPDDRIIFDHIEDFQSREKIQIVAPGINGVAHYDELDPKCLTIVVNKSIELPIRKDVWLVADYTQSTTAEWFFYGIQKHADIACLQKGYLADAHPNARWTFDPGPLIKTELVWPSPLPRTLRYGATVSGQAIQLAYWLGAKEIIICGMDFSGDSYFDGKSRNVAPQYLSWKIKKPMNKLIQWMNSQGIKISSLSETALKI